MKTDYNFQTEDWLRRDEGPEEEAAKSAWTSPSSQSLNLPGSLEGAELSDVFRTTQ